MRLKINFFGASVTQQKNGYAWAFKNANPNVDCSIFGYGANHISGAGICYLSDALKNNPDFLILDWFSTGYCNENNLFKLCEYIEAILYRTINAGTRPIFLFLPQEISPRGIYESLMGHISKFNVPFLDIDRALSRRKDILRDSVHTNDLGSILYANEIISYFTERGLKYPYSLSIPAINKYCEVKEIEINKVIQKKLVIEGEAEVIGISQTIGPYTGYVKIDNYLEKLWDRWCYYERNMMLLNIHVSGQKEIEVLQCDFDRSEADRAIAWPSEKFLNLYTLYFSGQDLRIHDAY